jgi:broad specificity phosphatase PhoE
MTRLWLIRHAIVEPQARLYLYGTLDVEVCEETLALQAPAYRALAARLPQAATWYVTPLKRTRRTAEAIFAAGYGARPLVVEPDLTEQSLGEWQGLVHSDLPGKLATPMHPFWPIGGRERPPGGESIEEVIVRVGRGLERLVRDHPAQDVVVVGHGGAIRAAVAHALGLSPDQALHLSVANLSLTMLERHLDAWRVVSVNEPPAHAGSA